ncbi:flavin reductase family protein [Streptomyces abikoensis]|uniref:flavin reductase family protein n=1 Tax=Streptomyces abikoensis TaxID=97398 RepID=UPI00369F37B0
MPDATVRLACDTHAVLDGGDHSILIGRVEALATEKQTSLIYYRRQFASPRTPILEEAR